MRSSTPASIKAVILLMFFAASSLALARAKTFIYCSEASPKIFNPQLATDGPTFNASSKTIYNRLVDFKPGGTEIVPSLAKAWKITRGGRVYTFTLRKNVSFQTTPYFKPTRPFNADDVVFTFERMLNPHHPFHNVSGGAYEYFYSMNLQKLIKSVKKTGDDKVQFVLSHAEAPFLADLAMDFASILSAEYGQQVLKQGHPEWLDLKPVGTGPFQLVKYVKDTVIRFKRNPHYFQGPAAIENLIFAITPDASVRTQKLIAGECHLIAEPSPTDIATLKKNAGIKVMESPGLNVGYLAMNTQKKPFNNVKVRQAINYALDKMSYIKTIYQGHATIANGPLPPSMWGVDKNIKPYKYNLKKAKQLLKEAGYPNGFAATLWTLPVSRPYNPDGKKMGELMQADLAKVGIKVTLVTYKWATYLEKASKGEHQMVQLGWTGDNGDPDNFLYVLLGCAAVEGGSNYSRWCDKKFDQLVSKAKLSSHQSLRSRLYQRAQVIFNQQVPWVPIANATVFRAMSKAVTGYKISPFGTESFYGVDLK